MWRHYIIAIANGGQQERQYAPDLDTAFRLARVQWPAGDPRWTMNSALTCLDSFTDEEWEKQDGSYARKAVLQ